MVLHAWDKEDGLYFERGSVFTDEDGEYSFTGLTAGRFKVQVDCKGSRFLSQWWADTEAGSMDAGGAKRITLSAGQNRTGIDFKLQVGAVVSGSVTRVDTGEALQGVRIKAFRLDEGSDDEYFREESSALSGEDGRYSIVGLPSGEYRIQFDGRSSNFAIQWWTGSDGGSTLGSEAASFSISRGVEKEQVDAKLLVSASISGTVVSADSLEPIENVRVDAYVRHEDYGFYEWEGFVLTDAHGAYSIIGLLPGTYKIRFDGRDLKYGVQWWDRGANQEAAVPITLDMGESRPEVTAQLNRFPTVTVGTPTISGTVKAGKTLTAKPGSWTSGTTFAYQWQLGGKDITGATKSTYKIKDTDGGKKLTVTVTGTKPGHTTASATSAPTKTVPLSKLKTATPKISGTAKVGKTLTAKPGSWTSGTTFKYQWYRGSTKINGATKSTYKLTNSDAKKKVKVKVTGTKTGYTTATKSSKSTKTIKK